MATSQNTSEGGGGGLIPSTGNATLDAIFGAANVAVTGAANIYGLYDSYAEKALYRELQKKAATKAPDQSLPANQATTPLNYLSDPARAQQLFLMVGITAMLTAGVWYAVKKR